MSSSPGTPGDLPGADSAPRSGAVAGMARPLAVYTALRLGLTAVLTVLLMFVMPLLVALLLAIIVQLPLSWVIFRHQRERATAAMRAATSKRRAERERMRAALRGDDPAQ